MAVWWVLSRTPLRQLVGQKVKISLFPRETDPSRQLHWRAEGVARGIPCMTFAYFWPSANCMAWRSGIATCTRGRDRIRMKASFGVKPATLPAKKSGGGGRDELPGGLWLEG
jgi:hypothetical protein